MSAPRATLLAAMSDPVLFGRWFRDAATWAGWRAFIAALFALPMTAEQLAIYRECTGRDAPPTDAISEAWLVCGRRAGKSFVLALIAVFLACFHNYRRYLAPGERATILVIAADRKQARTILRYIGGLLTRIPLLSAMIERAWAEGYDLDNAVSIEVGTASYRSVRGYTICAALCDELAFWPTDDAAQPDYAILDALRPAMATIPGATLLCASSPYARRGALWDAYRKHFGKTGDPVLVWQASTRRMNPTVPQKVIDAAMERDAASAAAEYGAQFRTDLENFVLREAVQACISDGIRERPPMAWITYHAFVDPSGGSADSFTVAVGHKDAGKETAVIDCVREVKPPFSPEIVVEEFCRLLKTYRIASVTGDRYAGEWPREQFSKFGIRYEPTAKPKSELYIELLPLLNSCRIELLDVERLHSQLLGLERRTARGGKDSIDHAPGAHDDLANAVAGVAAVCIGAYGSYDPFFGEGKDESHDPEAERTWRRARLQAHLRNNGIVF